MRRSPILLQVSYLTPPSTVRAVTSKLAAIYTRISRDPEGERLGVQRQLDDCLALAKRLGYEVFDVYTDNDIGASTRSRLKPRPGYTRMIADGQAAKYQTIVAYTSGRLTRRPREREDLIELAEHRAVKIHYLKSPDIDLNSADGRMVARFLAANDTAESERIAERVSRAALQRAEQGAFHGSRQPFGFELVKDAAGKVVALREHEQHAAMMREAIERILDGDTVYGICIDWNKRGLVTSQGVIWRPKTLKTCVQSPGIVGKRVYRDQVYDAQWPAIVDETDWSRVRDLLSNPERQVRGFNNGNARKHALSGLLRCGTCGKVLVSMTSTRLHQPSFICNAIATGGCGSMRISMQPLENYVRDMVFAALDSPAIDREMSTAGQPDGDKYAELRRALAADGERLQKIEDDHYDNVLTRSAYLRQKDRIETRMRETEAAMQQSAAETVLNRLPRGNELRIMWGEQDASWRRQLLSAVLDHIVVSSFPKGKASNLTKRKIETDAEFTERRESHQVDILEDRTEIIWRA